MNFRAVVLLGLLLLSNSILASSMFNVPSTYNYLQGVGYVEINTPYNGDEDRTWFDAVAKCQREGGDILSFQSAEELKIVRDHIALTMNRTDLPYWVGFHDLFLEGEYLHMKGRSISTIQGFTWVDGEPNGNTIENCIIMNGHGDMNDNHCDYKYPSLCKIEVWKTYTHVSGVGYYQFYPSDMNWFQARKKCRDDGAMLAVINSNEEAAVIAELLGASKAFVGLHDMFNEGHFRTDEGLAIQDVGWNVFAVSEPSDTSGSENCLAFYDGFLFDESCSLAQGFVCEHGLY